jgi:hypothetical protein
LALSRIGGFPTVNLKASETLASSAILRLLALGCVGRFDDIKVSLGRAEGRIGFKVGRATGIELAGKAADIE